MTKKIVTKTHCASMTSTSNSPFPVMIVKVSKSPSSSVQSNTAAKSATKVEKATCVSSKIKESEDIEQVGAYRLPSPICEKRFTILRNIQRTRLGKITFTEIQNTGNFVRTKMRKISNKISALIDKKVLQNLDMLDFAIGPKISFKLVLLLLLLGIYECLSRGRSDP